MIIEAIAPVRIDLAGGTLDLYPLYLFLDGAVTVNMAINLTCHVRVEPSHDNRLQITSLDSNQSVAVESREALPLEGPLGFICRAVRFFHPGGGLIVTTNTSVPRGSGLGASSALLVALGGALCRYHNIKLSKETLVDRIAQLEAQSIGVPTGKQDYYAALYGGVNALHFEVGGDRVEKLVEDADFLKRLEQHCILTFTGESRQSAIANWDMMKAFVEDWGDNRAKMRGVKSIALQMREALLQQDLHTVGQLLAQEWACRKNLAQAVSTPHTEALIAAARQAGAAASKICGAGGGGCMITLAPPECRRQVIAALKRTGARELPFRISRQGLRVKQVEG